MKYACVLISLGLIAAQPAFADDVCTFDDWAWDTQNNEAVDFERRVISRDQLTDEQIHPDLPCSVCEEDMTVIKMENTAPIKVCRVVAPAIQSALRQAKNEGFQIKSLTGYRVGRTKGPVDGQGRRTQYSYHSFGLAIDINADSNGLYGNCITFGPTCELKRGGPWQAENPDSITPDSPIYRSMRSIGFKWGGELNGRQKDFMHFSLSGD